jgi:serine/threonine-protein kinase
VRHAAVLDYPAVVAVYDSGETGDTEETLPYVVMEYVAGHTLRRALTIGGPTDPGRALETMADVCAALDFAHGRGVVHGDLKPANVMITRSGAVKVADFGIARALSGDAAPATRGEGAVGAATYLAPEQVRGEREDARSDVYAAGCVLFEMLAGSPPGEDRGRAAAYRQAGERLRAPSEVNPAVGGQVDAIVLTAMERNPADIYQSAGAMRADLLQALRPGRPAAARAESGAEATAVLRPDAVGAGPAGQAESGTSESGTSEAGSTPRRRGVRVGLLVLLGVAVLACGVAAAVTLLGGPSPVAVPNLQGNPVAAATARLQDLHLKPQRHQVYCQAGADGTAAPCGAKQIGTVLRTDPPSGEQARAGSTVAVYVAAPAQEVAVPPDLAGQTLQEATTELRRLGLQVSPHHGTQPVTDPGRLGAVVASDPAAGTRVDKGTPVTLTVGVKPPTVAVPDETGLPGLQAAGDLQDLGFQVETQQADSTEPQGTVIAQDPGGGRAERGSTVTLTVSKGVTPTPAPDGGNQPPPSEAPPGGASGDRGPNGLGTYVCTQDKLYFAACNPDTLGQVEQYPPYNGHGG